MAAKSTLQNHDFFLGVHLAFRWAVKKQRRFGKCFVFLLLFHGGFPCEADNFLL